MLPVPLLPVSLRSRFALTGGFTASEPELELPDFDFTVMPKSSWLRLSTLLMLLGICGVLGADSEGLLGPLDSDITSMV